MNTNTDIIAEKIDDKNISQQGELSNLLAKHYALVQETIERIEWANNSDFQDYIRPVKEALSASIEDLAREITTINQIDLEKYNIHLPEKKHSEMSYGKFSLEEVIEKFALSYQEVPLFEGVEDVKISEHLALSLKEGIPLALPNGSELARQNYIVTPVLLEVRRNANYEITLYSGVDLKADKEKGLNGECDVILSKSKITAFVDTPIFTLVEAEKQNMDAGIGQCAAQMMGAQVFNKRKKKEVRAIYGCVTTGAEWQFLKLSENELILGTERYYIDDVESILGVLKYVVDTIEVVKK